MNKNLSDYRKSYDKNKLEEEHLPETPLELFSTWFKEVEEEGGVDEINAMTVSTIGLDSFPKARVVLLKNFDENGFVFYTNYTSEKGEAIENNPVICLSFFWSNLERQVIIKGKVSKVSEKQSTEYYHSRPRGSQLGAWASDQSEVIPSREFLEKKLKTLEKKYENKEIPKPDYWGGYLVKPVVFEFWQGRPNRLHDRIRYTPLSVDHKKWKKDRLAP